jgi:hypothetical protein
MRYGGTLLAAVLIGTALGLGAFTFVYAKGASYLSTDPAVCANCHIMGEHYAAWQRSSHRAVAGCSDCHMPKEAWAMPPSVVEARYQRLLERRERNPNADDPLFRPIDANDFRTNGQNASDFSLLRKGLVRITIPLPSNRIAASALPSMTAREAGIA